jgi:hypothetical protein
VPALTGLDCNGARPGPALYLPEYSDDNSRQRQALVLSKRLVDAFFYRFVLRPQRHFVVLRMLFSPPHGRLLSPALLLLCRVGPLLSRMLEPERSCTR